jgi:protocatechuate 3,4-dioxygenase beta subunit
MYFPGDPLLAHDPMYLSVPGEEARLWLTAALDWETTVPEEAVGYRFDIVLRGREATPTEGPPGGRP